MRWILKSACRAVGIAMLLPLGTIAAQPSSRGALVVRLGQDTLSVEQWTRTASRMEGDYVRRVPSAQQWHYVAVLDSAGLPRTLELTPVRARAPNAFNGLKRITLRWDADSVTSESLRDTIVRRRRASKSGSPVLPDSYAFFELWLSWMRRTGRDSATVAMAAPLGGPQGALAVRVRGDSAWALVFGGPIRMRADADGRLLSLDATASTIKHIATREPEVNLDRVFRSFAQRESKFGAPGTFISGRDTVQATIGAAHIWVDYGRPSVRGRQVFAAGVLGDTLWRTGANAATQFRTDRELRFGDRALPAGQYSLWTHVVDREHVDLIFNAQSGQWGTEYHRERDVIRVPMSVRRGVHPAEELFSIAVSQSQNSDGGVVRLLWADTEWTLPFASPTAAKDP